MSSAVGGNRCVVDDRPGNRCPLPLHKRMISCYVVFSSLKRPLKKDEVPVLVWVLIGRDVKHIIEQAEDIGNDPEVVSGPYQLNEDWR